MAELPSPESICEARATNPDAFGPSRLRGMEVHAVRIAEVWFLESVTHAMPDSFCDDGEPDNLVDEAIELECEDPELTEHGEIDHEIETPGISDDPFVVAQVWVDHNVLEPSQVSLAHIGDPEVASGPDVAVQRDGRAMALLDLVPAEGGGLLVSSFSACPADLENET